MTGIICESCQHYRKAIHLSHRLLEIVNTSDGTVDSTIAEAIGRIEDDERRVEDEEINTKERREGDGRLDWGHRPLMSDYCGLRENQAKYLIAELVRFSELECEHYRPRLPLQQEHNCISCLHRSTPVGPRQDANNLDRIMSGFAAGQGTGLFGGSSSSAGSWLGENRQYMQGIRQRQAGEIGRAYKELGTVRIEPQYFPYCKKFSSVNRHVLCVWQNPHNSCPDWETVIDEETVSSSSQSRFEIKIDNIYNHPRGGYSILYRQQAPGSPRYLQISVPFNDKTADFALEKIPEGKWVRLRIPPDLLLPLKVFKEAQRIFAEWLLE